MWKVEYCLVFFCNWFSTVYLFIFLYDLRKNKTQQWFILRHKNIYNGWSTRVLNPIHVEIIDIEHWLWLSFSCFYFQIFMLLFLLLYFGSFALIGRFRRRDREDLFSTDDDEVTVYRISLWLCTFSLAVAIGSALLLPISIASNEVLLLYPRSYYVKWLNSSLIQGKIPLNKWF